MTRSQVLTGEVERIQRHLRGGFPNTISERHQKLLQTSHIVRSYPWEASRPTASPGSTKLHMYLTFMSSRNRLEESSGFRLLIGRP